MVGDDDIYFISIYMWFIFIYHVNIYIYIWIIYVYTSLSLLAYFQSFIIAHQVFNDPLLEDGTAEGADCPVGDWGCVPDLAESELHAGGAGAAGGMSINVFTLW